MNEYGEYEEYEEEQPEEGDFILYDSHGGLAVSIMNEKYLGTFKGDTPYEDAEKAIIERMVLDGFYPNVWWEDDHGGVTPYTFDIDRDEYEKEVRREYGK
jgi:hypothetical protein